MEEMKDKYKYYAKKKRSYGFIYSNSLEWFLENVRRYCGDTFDLWVDGVQIKNPQEYLNRISPHTLERKIVDMCLKEETLQNDLDSANSKVSELSNRILEAISLNEKILNMIDDGCSREQFLPYLKEQQKILKGSGK